MPWLNRLVRHARLTWQAWRPHKRRTPPFLILFVNSKCNLTCEHCFYWRNLNRSDDLSYEELRRLSLELGAVENLNLSGGEPFLRPDLADVCSLFVQNNAVKQIYVPTNGYYVERMHQQLRRMLRHDSLKLLTCELSLDGMPDYHNRFRGNPKSFAKAMEAYEMLAQMQQKDARLRVHAISTATHENLEEIHRLTAYLHRRCPAMDHHNLALIRGDRKNPGLRGPALERYERLYEEIIELWRDRESGRFGSIVEPMLQWAKLRTARTATQLVPCTAGNLTGVVYANGDVALCETHPPLGNLREKSFFAIWSSPEAEALRARVRARRCHCTNEVFLWPSIVFQPWQLLRALLGSRARRVKQPGGLSLPTVSRP